jgi:trehalose 6-phosphate synthase
VALEGDSLLVEGRPLRTGVFPVGVNTDEVRAAAGGPLPEAARVARESGLPLVVGLERADFTKGVPERLRAMAAAWRSGARFAYYGSSSPTRQGVALYDGFADVLKRETADAAQAAARAGCPFVHEDASLSWQEVVAVLGAADIVFTSSLADGMNLVPLQAAIAQEGRSPRGVVFAGAEAGVSHAYAAFAGQGLAVVDPLDIEATALALQRAVAGECAGISDAFVEAVRSRDAGHWAAAFMAALEESDAEH